MLHIYIYVCAVYMYIDTNLCVDKYCIYIYIYVYYGILNYSSVFDQNCNDFSLNFADPMEAMWIGFDQFHLCVKIGIEALGTGYDGFNVQYPIYILNLRNNGDFSHGKISWSMALQSLDQFTRMIQLWREHHGPSFSSEKTETSVRWIDCNKLYVMYIYNYI